jgi:hypothetical protein
LVHVPHCGCATARLTRTTRAGELRSARGRRRVAPGLSALLGAVLASTLLGSCDDTFEPFAPGAASYSTFGYLDASADTQWIRVRAARTGLLASTARSGLMVSLQDLSSGRIIELRDTALPFVNMLSSDPVYAHDFMTTERIEPGAAYRFRASGWDTVVAESEVRIPRDYNVQLWTTASGANVWTGGVKYVPFLISYASYYTDCEAAGLKRFAESKGAAGDSVSRLNSAPSTGISTSNSLGFLGGVLTRWIPVERCRPAYPAPGEPYCKLRFDSTTATLSGSVTSACPVPADSINIEMRELEAIPPEAPRIRTANHTDQDRNFEIGALRPGIPYELIVFVGDTTGRFHPSLYRVYRDTLRFTAGQRLTYQATLERLAACQ